MVPIVQAFQLIGLFFNSALGKQVASDVKLKLNKTKRPWYLSRRFVGVIVAGLAQVASNLVTGLDISDAQATQVTGYLLQGLDMITVYGGSLSVFGFTNRK
ncbi:hypothetical protein LCGC14_1259700 [marine sediment metagenome]|uniref:Uncharacterized protein n=1 Tax=marine sediment metagenome TaxID=412755 RepID=A0A0F9P4G6_9ZZZZ